VVSTHAGEALADRLLALHRGLASLIGEWTPDEAAVENTYMARTPKVRSKLGQARGES
jgi:crossover junction endodeoxyribonuclease RuvC